MKVGGNDMYLYYCDLTVIDITFASIRGKTDHGLYDVRANKLFFSEIGLC